jgi:hypothetical protein
MLRGSYGRTEIRVPWLAAYLWEAYHDDPGRTLTEFRALMGALLAPMICQGQASPLAGGDKTAVEQWARRWNMARKFSDPHGPTWEQLRPQVEHSVVAWYWKPGAREERAAVAQTLLRKQSLTGAELRDVVERHRRDVKFAARSVTRRTPLQKGLYDYRYTGPEFAY